MSCAARARRLDEAAEIIVLERGPHVSFANCGLPYYVGGEIDAAEELLVQTPDSLQAALRLDVRTHHDVIAVDTERRTLAVRTPHGDQELGYDALVLSPGARAARPPIPGLSSSRVRTLRTVADAVAVRDTVDNGAQRAVVLGAGFIGLEAAEALALKGLEVTVIERASHALPPLEPEIADPVRLELGRLGISLRTSISAEAIDSEPDHDVVRLSDGTQIRADLVVLAAGVQPDTAVFEAAGIATDRGAILVDEHGRTSAPQVWAIGDATAAPDPITKAPKVVALAGPANRAGRQVADDIVRPGSVRAIPAPLGTAIVRIGQLTTAMTGATSTTLQAAELEFTTIHLHPNQHAGYFPGAAAMHLVIHFGTEDGRLLGAQAVGLEGVDKRIDVLATAMRAGLSVADLVDLDLGYSPPYGQAKDAVNLAGMVGANVLDGTLRLWYATDLREQMDHALILDVRTDEEFASGHVRGSLHIPHTQLRERLEEVYEAAAGRPVRVLCGSGVRSAIAHRVLVQAGLDSASLSGGMRTLRSTLGDAADDLLTEAISSRP